MFRPLRLVALLALALGAFAASGGATTSIPPGLVSIRPGGLVGPLLGYDSASGARRFALPSGIASADGTAFFSARAAGGVTVLRRYSPHSGRLENRLRIHGAWTLGAVSANGRFVALARPGARATELLVLERGRIVHRLRLRGLFELDAIANRGARLFVIQRFAGQRYAVRGYDLVHGTLMGSIRPKGADESMVGTAWGQVASPDGRWLLTLYVNTNTRNAFVHALDLRAATAICVDLPGSGDLAQLKDYALALDPAQTEVYAANPTLGVVASVDLARLTVSSHRFARHPAGGWAASAVSRRRPAVWFTSGDARIWAYDMSSSRLRGPFAVGGRVIGLTFGRAGRLLFAPRENGGVAALDTFTGAVLRR